MNQTWRVVYNSKEGSLGQESFLRLKKGERTLLVVWFRQESFTTHPYVLVFPGRFGGYGDEHPLAPFAGFYSSRGLLKALNEIMQSSTFEELE